MIEKVERRGHDSFCFAWEVGGKKTMFLGSCSAGELDVVLVLLPARLALLAPCQGLELRGHRGEDLEDDGGGDVGANASGVRRMQVGAARKMRPMLKNKSLSRRAQPSEKKKERAFVISLGFCSGTTCAARQSAHKPLVPFSTAFGKEYHSLLGIGITPARMEETHPPLAFTDSTN